MPRGVPKSGKRNRRTKAQIAADNAFSNRVVEDLVPQKKRHRRTKAEMLALRASCSDKKEEAIVLETQPKKIEPIQSTMSKSEREIAGRAIHAKSILRFMTWEQLSPASREEFCSKAEKKS
jgi:hypothetical protein